MVDCFIFLRLLKCFTSAGPLPDLHRDYAGLQHITVEETEATNEELGIICKKNFFVAVVGL